MKKKCLAFLLALLSAAAVTGCKKDDSETSTESSEPIVVPVTTPYQTTARTTEAPADVISYSVDSKSENGKDIFTITAKDGSSKELWKYETQPAAHTEPAHLLPIGESEKGYMLFENGKILCLDQKTGKVSWEYEVGSDSIVAELDNNGSVYAAGWNGPMLCVLDMEGKCIYRREQYADEYSKPTAISVNSNGSADITFEQGGDTLTVYPTSDDIALTNEAELKEFLAGSWVYTDVDGNQLEIFLREDGSFEANRQGEEGQIQYTGKWETKRQNAAANALPDCISFPVQSHNDETFTAVKNLGDMKISEIAVSNGNYIMQLELQNPENALFDMVYEEKAPKLTKWNGYNIMTPFQITWKNHTFTAKCWGLSKNSVGGGVMWLTNEEGRSKQNYVRDDGIIYYAAPYNLSADAEYAKLPEDALEQNITVRVTTDENGVITAIN